MTDQPAWTWDEFVEAMEAAGWEVVKNRRGKIIRWRYTTASTFKAVSAMRPDWQEWAAQRQTPPPF